MNKILTTFFAFVSARDFMNQISFLQSTNEPTDATISTAVAIAHPLIQAIQTVTQTCTYMSVFLWVKRGSNQK